MAGRTGAMTTTGEGSTPGPALALLVGPTLAPGALARIRALRPDLEVVTDLNGPGLDRIRYLSAFTLPPGSFARLPGLRLVCSSGAGADALMAAPDRPPGLPVARTLDPLVASSITEYVLHRVLHEQRAVDAYARQQRERVWQRIPVPSAAETTVAILGLGHLGRHLAAALRALGYRVSGWSRGPHTLPGVACHHGEAGLQACLAGSRFVVCLLPLTPETTGLLDARRLGWMAPGAHLVNVARGGHVVAADLLAALDSGRLAGATLDVHEPEPLPADHPFWAHPKITVTPHVAARTSPAELAEQLCENIRRVEAGEPLLNPVDVDRGY
jgi:glyoxylate/hydroxypyruvate reductase A